MSIWKKVKLEEITKVITKGTTPTSIGYNFITKGINFVKIESITTNGKFLIDRMDHISEDCDEKMKRSRLIEKDILFSIAGAIGRTAIVTKEILPANINQALAIIRLNTSDIIPNFLVACLKSAYVCKQFERKKQGVAQLNLSLKDISELEIIYPNLIYQEKLLLIFDKAQELIDKRKEQIAACDELIKSLFYHMFGDPIRNSKKWDMCRLDELGKLERGKSKHRPRNAPELLNGPYPLIQTGDVANAGLYIKKYISTYSDQGLQQSKMWNKGTLCITIAANIAKTGILTFDACFPDSVVGFTNNKNSNNMFIQLWMTFLQQSLEDSAPESAQKNINLKILRELSVIVPPIDLQNDFAKKVEKIEQQKQLLERSLTELENNFNSLMQRAFKGELF